MRTIIFILLALLLSSCAHNYVWEHPGKDSYAFNDCNIVALNAKGQMARAMKGEENAELIAEKEYEITFDNCMENKGWRKVTVK
jgi:hypothetical protein